MGDPISILTSISLDNPVIRTIPLLWIIVFGIIDLKDKRLFAGTLRKLKSENNLIRTNCRARGSVPNINLQDTGEMCPIYNLLANYADINHHSLIKNSDNLFWKRIRQMVIKYQQAQIFELMIIQFAFAYLMITMDGVKNVGEVFLFFAIIILAIFLGAYGYNIDDSIKFLENKFYMLSFISLVWLGLVSMMLFYKIIYSNV